MCCSDAYHDYLRMVFGPFFLAYIGGIRMRHLFRQASLRPWSSPWLSSYEELHVMNDPYAHEDRWHECWSPCLLTVEYWKLKPERAKKKESEESAVEVKTLEPKNLMSMCLVRPWFTGFFVIYMHDWLSSKITSSGPESLAAFRISHSRRWIHLPSWIARLSAMYSASLLDSDTLDCFLLPQLMGAPRSINANPPKSTCD